MRSIILGCLLAFSIILNIGTLAVTSVATVVSGLFTSVTGIGTVLGAAGEALSLADGRLATTESELKTVKAKNVDLTRELGSSKARTTQLGGELNAERKKTAGLDVELKGTRKKNAELLQEVADFKGAKLVTYRGEKRTINFAVSDTSTRISTRTAAGASRNLAATFGEAWPVAGTAVIVTATTLELYDACVIMRDLHQLDVAFNPDAAFGADATEVCGLRVPTAEEIWAKIKSSPGEVWKMVTEALPDLLDTTDWEVPNPLEDYVLSLPWGDYVIRHPWE